MPSSPFSENCKPPKPPILASLSGGLSVKANLREKFIEKIENTKLPGLNFNEIVCKFFTQKLTNEFRRNFHQSFQIEIFSSITNE